MIHEHRTYTCRPGTLRRHLDLYAAHGYAPQCRHLGRPVLFATTEAGDVNSYVHVWAYASMEDREARRAALWADPDWLAYVALSREAGCLAIQVPSLLRPVAFADHGGAA